MVEISGAVVAQIIWLLVCFHLCSIGIDISKGKNIGAAIYSVCYNYVLIIACVALSYVTVKP
jgi:hypothetical protein